MFKNQEQGSEEIPCWEQKLSESLLKTVMFRVTSENRKWSESRLKTSYLESRAKPRKKFRVKSKAAAAENRNVQTENVQRHV